ncbi:hemolysin family protein [Cellulomonas denverensis]|uniref:HlyC/CorC family transporter n=1 Tax=Cellulomonas denverensis TaxID=264297 RepID=A0A7X6KWS4_9CELL|nr:hemolysin family protein [Cellulomonas denverensis]NKY23691.1 HlyC/CorC family transporter [Cellulomonas denverensis]GIG26967.1 membrane protein [Cellulomonas denverensis]
MHEVPIGLLVALAVLALLVAALLSAGEAAILRVSRGQIAELAAARHPAASRIEALCEDRARVASSAGTLRLLCEMVAAVCITLAIAASTLTWSLELVIAVVACAFLTIVLARLSPRSVGQRRAVPVLKATSRLLSGVRRVVGPLLRITEPAGNLDERELREMVERDGRESIDDDEREMLRSVLGLGETLTREVMVPRTDMVTTGEQTPLRKVLSLLLRSGFSRVPVIGEQVDDLRGVIYLKDLVRRMEEDPASVDAPAVSVVRPAVFVPESKPVDELLRELQAGASHIAMVVDEYGGIAGLVTIEDALEEIVGELTDEHDPSAPTVEDLGGGTFLVPARLGRDELGELFGIEVEDDEVDTAGGLLAKALGKVPIPGSAGEIHGLRLVAQGTEGRRKRVARVLVSRVPDDQPDDEAAADPAPVNHTEERP